MVNRHGVPSVCSVPPLLLLSGAVRRWDALAAAMRELPGRACSSSGLLVTCHRRLTAVGQDKAAGFPREVAAVLP